MIEPRDIERLQNHEWLNDNLIGAYIHFLENHVRQTNEHLGSQIYFFNSFFYAFLTRDETINYKAVQNWTKSVDIFNYEYIIVPINESHHWYAAIIYGLRGIFPLMQETGGGRNPSRGPTIIIIDSLNNIHPVAIQALKDYLCEEAKSKRGDWIDVNLIQDRNAQGIPLQHNSTDCGLYLLMYIEKFVQDPDGFIRNLIQGDGNIDWPNLGASTLRCRLQKFLDDLYTEQVIKKQEKTALVPALCV